MGLAVNSEPQAKEGELGKYIHLVNDDMRHLNHQQRVSKVKELLKTSWKTKIFRYSIWESGEVLKYLTLGNGNIQ